MVQKLEQANIHNSIKQASIEERLKEKGEVFHGGKQKVDSNYELIVKEESEIKHSGKEKEMDEQENSFKGP